MNESFKVCWYCPTNLDIDKCQDNTEVLPILGVLKWVFPFGVSQFCKNLSLNSLFLIIVVLFFCGQDNLLGGQFWAMDRFNLLGGQINLLGGQMPTQLTCYLPPWYRTLHMNYPNCKPWNKVTGTRSKFVVKVAPVHRILPEPGAIWKDQEQFSKTQEIDDNHVLWGQLA